MSDRYLVRNANYLTDVCPNGATVSPIFVTEMTQRDKRIARKWLVTMAARHPYGRYAAAEVAIAAHSNGVAVPRSLRFALGESWTVFPEGLVK